MENLEEKQPQPERGQQAASNRQQVTAPEAAPQIPKPLVPEDKQKPPFLLAILLSLVILFLGGGIVFVYFRFLKPGKVVSQPVVSPTPVSVASPSPSPNPDVTAGWETYRNEEYGFEIKYPKDWTVSKDSYVFKEGGDLFSIYIWGETQKTTTELYDGAGLTIGSVIQTGKDIKTWAKEYYGEKSILYDTPNEFSQEVINGLPFQKAKMGGSPPSPLIYYNTKRNNYIYRIVTVARGSMEKQYRDIINQILSTLKFIKKQTAGCLKLEKLEMEELTRTTELDCQQCGGKWELLSKDMDMIGCSPKTSDAGKSCTNYDQCVGICLVKDESSVSGTCSEFKFVLGCSLEFSEGEKVTICRD